MAVRTDPLRPLDRFTCEKLGTPARGVLTLRTPVAESARSREVAIRAGLRKPAATDA